MATALRGHLVVLWLTTGARPCWHMTHTCVHTRTSTHTSSTMFSPCTLSFSSQPLFFTHGSLSDVPSQEKPRPRNFVTVSQRAQHRVPENGSSKIEFNRHKLYNLHLCFSYCGMSACRLWKRCEKKLTAAHYSAWGSFSFVIAAHQMKQLSAILTPWSKS